MNLLCAHRTRMLPSRGVPFPPGTLAAASIPSSAVKVVRHKHDFPDKRGLDKKKDHGDWHIKAGTYPLKRGEQLGGYAVSGQKLMASGFENARDPGRLICCRTPPLMISSCCHPGTADTLICGG